MAEGAVNAVYAIKNAVIVHAVLVLIARKRHVAVFAFFRVLAVRAVFVLHALQPDVRRLLAQKLELFQECHISNIPVVLDSIAPVELLQKLKNVIIE